MKNYTKIVITGGPCAGKTTALNMIKSKFSERGYNVIVIPETATELISGGVSPFSMQSNVDYQLCQMKLQLAKESIFSEATEKLLQKDKVLILCDRGMLDNKAYMSENDFSKTCFELNVDEQQMLNMYDAVFHLVTAAKGAEKFYTLSNNKARTETPESARLLDERLILAWSGHKYHKIIENNEGFELKMKKLEEELIRFLDVSSLD